MAGINFFYRNSDRKMLSEGQLTRYVHESYQLTGSLNGRIGEFLNWQYRLNHGMNGLRMKEQTDRRLRQWMHTLTLTASFFERLNLQAGGEYYHNEIDKNRFKDMLLVDGKVTYSLNRNIELTATVSNLLNKKNYSYTLYSDLSGISYDRMIRGREFLMSVYIKKRLNQTQGFTGGPFFLR